MKTWTFFFSDAFDLHPETVDEHGALNISLLTDLPLFIDPFLLFYSSDPRYRKLHDQIIDYLRCLKDRSERGGVSRGQLKALYTFSEVKQNWLGFSATGNRGRGLGAAFATSLNENLVQVFADFGHEQITQSPHLEKLCLIDEGVGRDMISDFTTNLIKDFLLEYTQAFATRYLRPSQVRTFSVARTVFDRDHAVWHQKEYVLPLYQDDFIILTPSNMLTKDKTWINRADMFRRFREIQEATDDEVLREQLNEYFKRQIPAGRSITDAEERAINARAFRLFPKLCDYYIRRKEESGREAISESRDRVNWVEELCAQVMELVILLKQKTRFYDLTISSKEETEKRILYLKDVIENKGGHRFFYVRGEPLRREEDLHRLFRMTWFDSPVKVSAEVNDGRGPVDFQVTGGPRDTTLVEFKLASNRRLAANLVSQLETYKKASSAQRGFKVIVYFTEAEGKRVQEILKDLKMEGDPYIVLIDARSDNKASGSRM